MRRHGKRIDTIYKGQLIFGQNRKAVTLILTTMATAGSRRPFSEWGRPLEGVDWTVTEEDKRLSRMLNSTEMKSILTNPDIKSNLDLSYTNLLDIDFSNLHIKNAELT